MDKEGFEKIREIVSTEDGGDSVSHTASRVSFPNELEADETARFIDIDTRHQAKILNLLHDSDILLVGSPWKEKGPVLKLIGTVALPDQSRSRSHPDFRMTFEDVWADTRNAY